MKLLAGLIRLFKCPITTRSRTFNRPFFWKFWLKLFLLASIFSRLILIPLKTKNKFYFKPFPMYRKEYSPSVKHSLLVVEVYIGVIYFSICLFSDYVFCKLIQQEICLFSIDSEGIHMIYGYPQFGLANLHSLHISKGRDIP